MENEEQVVQEEAAIQESPAVEEETEPTPPEDSGGEVGQEQGEPVDLIQAAPEVPVQNQIADFPDYPLEQQIDRKFKFVAVSRSGGNEYDESDAVVFLARDPALLFALDGYLTGCIALGADVNQIEAVKLLKERVMKFQEAGNIQMPGVETDEEMQRLS